MKHRIFGKKLGRNSNQRKALFRSLARELFVRGAIETTQAKAKSVVSTVEHLCNYAIKKSDITSRREFLRYFQDRNLVNKFIVSIKKAFGDQHFNFTKFTPVKVRQGDSSLIVKLEFVKPYVLEALEKKIEKTPKTVKPMKKSKKVTKKTVKEVKNDK